MSNLPLSIKVVRLKMTDKLTKEQIQRLWEKCGLKSVQLFDGRWLHIVDGDACYLDLDLNNLFKFAVPQLGVKSITFDGFDEWNCTLCTYASSVKFVDFLGKPQKTHSITESSIDPVLALFWACYKAFGLEK